MSVQKAKRGSIYWIKNMLFKTRFMSFFSVIYFFGSWKVKLGFFKGNLKKQVS